MSDISAYLLRWKGRTLGPFTLEDIHMRLATGELSRMHQIEHFGQWRPLDEFLRETEESERARASKHARDEELERRQMERELADERIRTAALAQQFAWMQEKHQKQRELLSIPPSRRTSAQAVIAFVLSLCNFVPFVNFIAWIPAIVLGHLALKETERDRLVDGRGLAVAALVISYSCLALVALFAFALAFGLFKGVR